MLAGEFAQGVEQFGHLFRGDLDLLKDFVAIELELVGFVKKFGIGNHSGQGMAQVVRNRAGSPSQGRDLLGFDLAALEGEQVAAHPGEGSPQFHDFGAATRRDRKGVIAAGEGAHGGQQVIHRLGDRPGHEAEHQRGETRAEMPSARMVRSNLPMKLMGRRKGISTKHCTGMCGSAWSETSATS